MKTKLKGESRSLIGSFCDRLLWWFLDHVSGPHFFYFFFLFLFFLSFVFSQFRIFLFSPSEENDPKRRQMRLHRSVSILTVVFSRPLRHEWIEENTTDEDSLVPHRVFSRRDRPKKDRNPRFASPPSVLTATSPSSLVSSVRRVSRSCSRLLHHLFSNPLEKDRNPPQALVLLLVLENWVYIFVPAGHLSD